MDEDRTLLGVVSAGPGTATLDLHRTARMRAWQLTTMAALLVGYSGYYVCRSNLSVALPAMLADPTVRLDRLTVGAMSSAGILAYATGKSITGVAGDFWGGRRLFLGGLFASVAATIAFGVSASTTSLTV